MWTLRSGAGSPEILFLSFASTGTSFFPQEQGKGMAKHLGSQVGKRLNVCPVHATGKGEGSKDAKNETA